jgi:hypothetical protein
VEELLGDLKTILEAQGIQFTDIAGVMSEEEHRSSLASTAGGWRPHGELHVEAPPPLHSSLEPDTIYYLAQPTACNLVVMIGGSFWMEVRRGLVYPHQTLLDDIQIDASAYAMVKVDMVYENSKNLKLEVPSDDMTLTLRDAITKRVPWRTSIDVDPSATTSVLATASQPNTTLALIFPNTQPNQRQIQPCPSPIREQSCLSPIQE